MRDDILDLWADALESGEYKQGTGSLAYAVDLLDDDGERIGSEVHYCCLGVLCEVMTKHDLMPEGFRWSGQGVMCGGHEIAHVGLTPLGLNRIIFGEASGPAAAGRFAKANDAFRMPFAEIAVEVRNRNFFAGLPESPPATPTFATA